MNDKFLTWLNAQILIHHRSQREFARLAGFSTSHVSQVLSGQRDVSADFCVKAARALNADPVAVLRLASILPPAVGETTDSWTAKCWSLIQQIPAADRATVIKALRAWASHPDP